MPAQGLVPTGAPQVFVHFSGGVLSVTRGREGIGVILTDQAAGSVCQGSFCCFITHFTRTAVPHWQGLVGGNLRKAWVQRWALCLHQFGPGGLDSFGVQVPWGRVMLRAL